MIVPWYRPIHTLPPADMVKKHQSEREKQYDAVERQIFSDLEFIQAILEGTSNVYRHTDQTHEHDLGRIYILHRAVSVNVSILVVYMYNLCVSFYQDIPDDLVFCLAEYIEPAPKPEDQHLKDSYAQQSCFWFDHDKDKWVLSDIYREMCEKARKCAIELLQVIPTKIP